MKKYLILSLTLLISYTGFGQEDMQTGIIYGYNHAFSLTAPKGWVLDNKSAVKYGIYAVFYKKGESWANAETVMYVNTASFENSAHRTLEELINYDLDNFRKNYSNLEILDGKDIQIKDGISAKVKYLSGESYKNYEAIAYIAAKNTGIMIIMSSRTKDGFDKSLDAFEKLVKSYFYIADKVIIDTVKE